MELRDGFRFSKKSNKILVDKFFLPYQALVRQFGDCAQGTVLQQIVHLLPCLVIYFGLVLIYPINSVDQQA